MRDGKGHARKHEGRGEYSAVKPFVGIWAKAPYGKETWRGGDREGGLSCRAARAYFERVPILHAKIAQRLINGLLALEPEHDRPGIAILMLSRCLGDIATLSRYAAQECHLNAVVARRNIIVSGFDRHRRGGTLDSRAKHDVDPSKGKHISTLHLVFFPRPCRQEASLGTASKKVRTSPSTGEGSERY